MRVSISFAWGAVDQDIIEFFLLAHEPRPHKHPFEQIAYIAAGVCDYHIEDQVFRLTPGGMLVIPPNLMHYAEVVGDEVLVNFDIFTPKREEYVK